MDIMKFEKMMDLISKETRIILYLRRKVIEYQSILEVPFRFKKFNVMEIKVLRTCDYIRVKDSFRTVYTPCLAIRLNDFEECEAERNNSVEYMTESPLLHKFGPIEWFQTILSDIECCYLVGSRKDKYIYLEKPDKRMCFKTMVINLTTKVVEDNVGFTKEEIENVFEIILNQRNQILKNMEHF